MYTDKMTGVRISLPTYPFYFYNSANLPVVYSAIPRDQMRWFDIRPEGIDDHLMVFTVIQDDFLKDVRYFRDYTKHPPRVIREIPNGISIDIGNFGTNKSDQWSFQREQRYRVIALPKELKTTFGDNQDRLQTTRDVLERNLPSSKFIYLDVSDEALAGIEIILGPRTTQADREIVESLLNRAMIDVVPTDSVFSGTIR
jgi:hypothetical protein